MGKSMTLSITGKSPNTHGTLNCQRSPEGLPKDIRTMYTFMEGWWQEGQNVVSVCTRPFQTSVDLNQHPDYQTEYSQQFRAWLQTQYPAATATATEHHVGAESFDSSTRAEERFTQQSQSQCNWPSTPQYQRLIVDWVPTEGGNAQVQRR